MLTQRELDRIDSQKYWTDGDIITFTVDVECECGQQQYWECVEVPVHTNNRYVLSGETPDIRCYNCGTLIYEEGEEYVVDEADYESLSERY